MSQTSHEILDLNHPDPLIRQIAIRDLEILGNSTAIQLLEQRLSKENNVELRFELKRSLNEFEAIQSGKTSLRKRETKHAVRIALLGTDKDMQSRACHYCAVNQRIEFLPLMIKVQETHTDPVVGVSCVYLMRFSPERWFPNLLGFLDSDQVLLVISALDSIGYIGSTQSVRMLLKTSTHDNLLIRETALRNLKSLGARKVGIIMSKILGQLEEWEKIALCQYITDSVELPFAELTQLLVRDESELVKAHAQLASDSLSARGFNPDSSIEKRSAAVRVLRARNYTEAQDMILNEPDPSQQATALLSFGVLDVPWVEKRSFLICFLHSEDNRIRANVLEAMATSCPDSELDFFLNYLDDENNRISGNAITALSRSSRFLVDFLPLIRERIEKMLKHTEEREVLTGLYCIGSLQEPSLIPMLLNMMDDARRSIRDRARQLLENWSLVSSEAFNAFQDYLQKEKLSVTMVQGHGIYALELATKNRGHIMQYPDHFGMY
ncbi:MAG: HEAT repeat domain-containing protein [Candidatus Cloacimonetes bacterium]|nr:HEAT repeat domain-containing protein [Candidatus Cloacimonadota bacterium]